MRNLTQSTYDRIKECLDPASDRWARRIAPQDVRDLLEAFEHAIELLHDGSPSGDCPTCRELGCPGRLGTCQWWE